MPTKDTLPRIINDLKTAYLKSVIVGQEQKDRLERNFLPYLTMNIEAMLDDDSKASHDKVKAALRALLQRQELPKLLRNVSFKAEEGISTLIYFISTPAYFITSNTKEISISDGVDSILSSLARATILKYLIDNQDKCSQLIPEEWLQAQQDFVRARTMPRAGVNPPQPPQNDPADDNRFENAFNAAHADNHHGIANQNPDEVDFRTKNDFSVKRVLKTLKSIFQPGAQMYPQRQVYDARNSILATIKNFILGTVDNTSLKNKRINLLKSMRSYLRLSKIALKRIILFPNSVTQALQTISAIVDSAKSIVVLVVRGLVYIALLSISISSLVLSLPVVIVQSVLNATLGRDSRVFEFILDLVDAIREIVVGFTAVTRYTNFVNMLTMPSLVTILTNGITLAAGLHFFWPFVCISLAAAVAEPELIKLVLDASAYLLNSTYFSAFCLPVGASMLLQTSLSSVALGVSFVANLANFIVREVNDALDRFIFSPLLGRRFVKEVSPVAPDLDIPQMDIMEKNFIFISAKLERLRNAMERQPISQASDLFDDAHHNDAEVQAECLNLYNRAQRQEPAVLDSPLLNRYIAFQNREEFKNQLPGILRHW